MENHFTVKAFYLQPGAKAFAVRTSKCKITLNFHNLKISFHFSTFQVLRNPLDGGVGGKRPKTDDGDDDDGFAPLLFIPEKDEDDIPLFQDWNSNLINAKPYLQSKALHC
jgi:hypothetical protein